MRSDTIMRSMAAATLSLAPLASGRLVAQTGAGTSASQSPAVSAAPNSRTGPGLGFSAFTSPTAPFAAYTGPTMCVSAALREEAIARRSAAAQIAMLLPRPDTLAWSAAAAAVAAQCGARWTVTATDTFEVPAIMRVSLIANEDRRAFEAARQWVSRVPAGDTAARAERLLQTIRLLLDARVRTPERAQYLNEATLAIRRAGTKAVEQQAALAQLYFEHVRLTGSLEARLAASDTVIDFVRQLPTEQLREWFRWPLVVGYLVRAFDFPSLPAGRLGSPLADSAYAIGIAMAQRDFARIPVLRNGSIPFKTYAEQIEPHHVGPMRPLVAQHWFGRPAGVTTLPRPGVPTIIVPVDQNCGEACYPLYAAYRRLYAAFAPRGVDFILMSRTAGYARTSVPQSIPDEVESIRSYFMDRQKLPGMLGVEETTFHTLPDGRKEADSSANPSPQGLGPPRPNIGLVNAAGIYFPSGLGSVYFGDPISENLAGPFIENQLLPAKP